MKRSIAHLLITLFLVIPAISYGAPENFRQAKIELKNKVYYDQAFNGALGTTYCGCNWRWVGGNREGALTLHPAATRLDRLNPTK